MREWGEWGVKTLSREQHGSAIIGRDREWELDGAYLKCEQFFFLVVDTKNEG